MRMRVAAALAGALACGHSEPFTPTPPDIVGPISATLPRRLTFNPLADRTPSTIGDTIVFARTEAGRADGDACLALLPVEGGRLHRMVCAGGLAADTVRDSWLYPVVSPDRRRVAFVFERRAILTGSLLRRTPVVAPVDTPDRIAVTVAGSYPLPAGGLGNAFHALSWADDTTIRFLGGTETVGQFGGFVPAGVFEFTVGADSSPEPRPVPELADAVRYALAEDGAVYFLSGGDGQVYRWTPESAPVAEAPFACLYGAGFGGLTDLAVSQGKLAVLATCIVENGSGSQLLVRDLADTATRAVGFPLEPRALTGVPGRGWVIVEADGDLWLAALR